MRPQVKSVLLVSVIALIVSHAATLVWARYYARHTYARSGDHPDKTSKDCLLDLLDLSSSQKERLSVLRSAMMARRRAHFERMDVLKSELAEAICSRNPDRAAMDKLLAEYSSREAAMQRIVVDHLLNVNALLDEAQQHEFCKLLRRQIFRRLQIRGSHNP